jgi:hypothetical protein
VPKDASGSKHDPLEPFAEGLGSPLLTVIPRSTGGEGAGESTRRDEIALRLLLKKKVLLRETDPNTMHLYQSGGDISPA